MDKRKDIRRKKAKSRLEKQLEIECKAEFTPLNVLRIEQEIKTLTDRLSGIKKPLKRDKDKIIVNGKKEDRWWIDIYSISYARIKRTERKKNKGKSRKKMRTQKTVALLRSVVAQEGMITNYRDGRMGMSPKNHKFVLRREVPTYLN